MFEWDEILSVGIDVVDDQHQEELFRIGRDCLCPGKYLRGSGPDDGIS